MSAVPLRGLAVVPYRKTRRFLRRHHSTVLGWLPAAAMPPSWETGPPDFVGVGAQRCGTTWWYAALEAQPQVQRVPASPKERNYFARFWEEPFTPDAVTRYHRLFPRAPGKIVGEWTPDYMFYFWTPALLRRCAPEARLLVLLRDPIERYRSAVTSDEARRGKIELPAESFERGLYHAQLMRLLGHFDRDRVLVLQYERCRDHPERELERTNRFLGLADTGFRPDALSRTINPTRWNKVALSAHVVDALRSDYRDDATRLFDEFPELDPTLWTTLDL
jgi:hypothetical protein